MMTRPRGRPRAFDREIALRSAQRFIWQHGFEAMSLSQLEDAMGIRRSSLYSAFGSKLGLLGEAADLYLADFAKQRAEVLPGIRSTLGRLEAMFGLFATNFAASGGPLGCFLCSAAHSCSNENAEAVNLLIIRRKAFAELIRAELETGVQSGEFILETPVAALTDFLVSVVQGMSIGARDGKPVDSLRQIATFALSVPARYVAPKDASPDPAATAL
ncbi:MAG: TetR/AcrR family transcriptional regulator [Methylobacterium sp.]|jgi:AcrR family transcriptional regulator|nr:TetR/AcrR family transcriptional regulator [Methylobacterium sp.]MCA3623417.1 TetR/AcrR family transcriptional regulator [Methylobacterium sp.]